MMSYVSSPSNITRSRSTTSTTYLTLPPPSPPEPERQNPHRLRLLLDVYSPRYVKFGYNKFTVGMYKVETFVIET